MPCSSDWYYFTNDSKEVIFIVRNGTWTGTNEQDFRSSIPSSPSPIDRSNSLGFHVVRREASSASAESWSSMTTTDAPAARCNFVSVWTGTEMLAWGGKETTNFVNTGGIYTPP